MNAKNCNLYSLTLSNDEVTYLRNNHFRLLEQATSYGYENNDCQTYRFYALPERLKDNIAFALEHKKDCIKIEKGDP